MESPKCMLGGRRLEKRGEERGTRRAAFCEAVSDVDEPSRKVLLWFAGVVHARILFETGLRYEVRVRIK